MAEVSGKSVGPGVRLVAESEPDKSEQDPDVARGAFAYDVLVRLAKAKMLVGSSENGDLTPETVQALQGLLTAQGIPAPNLKTRADAFWAMTRVDERGQCTIDLQLLQASGLVHKPGWAQAIPALADLVKVISGKGPGLEVFEAAAKSSYADGFGAKQIRRAAALPALSVIPVTPRPLSGAIIEPLLGTVDAPVQYALLANGTIAPRGDDLPPGAKPITWARLKIPKEGQAHLELGDQAEVYREFDVSSSGQSSDPSVSAEAAGVILKDLLAQANRATSRDSPAAHAWTDLVGGADGSPGPQARSRLNDYEVQIQTQRAFSRGPMPAQPGAAAVWRAARLELAQYDQASNDVAGRLGVQPKRWLGYMSDHRLTGFVDDVEAAALPKHGISASFLYSVAIGEGLGLFLDSTLKRNDVLNVDKDIDDPEWVPVDGFDYLGLDTFASQADGLRQKGYLPQDFREHSQYLSGTDENGLWGAQNEKGAARSTAIFRDVRSGLQALAATLADCRTAFLADVRKMKGPGATRPPTPDQINFFTYVYFNAGQTRGRELLGEKGLDLASKWQGAPPPNNKNAKFNSLQRLAFTQVIDKLGLFNAVSADAMAKGETPAVSRISGDGASADPSDRLARVLARVGFASERWPKVVAPELSPLIKELQQMIESDPAKLYELGGINIAVTGDKGAFLVKRDPHGGLALQRIPPGEFQKLLPDLEALRERRRLVDADDEKAAQAEAALVKTTLESTLTIPGAATQVMNWLSKSETSIDFDHMDRDLLVKQLGSAVASLEDGPPALDGARVRLRNLMILVALGTQLKVDMLAAYQGQKGDRQALEKARDQIQALLKQPKPTSATVLAWTGGIIPTDQFKTFLSETILPIVNEAIGHAAAGPSSHPE